MSKQPKVPMRAHIPACHYADEGCYIGGRKTPKHTIYAPRNRKEGIYTAVCRRRHVITGADDVYCCKRYEVTAEAMKAARCCRMAPGGQREHSAMSLRQVPMLQGKAMRKCAVKYAC